MVVSTAAFALPRSGGAVTRTLRVSPSHPSTAFREDDGMTLIRSLIASPPCYQRMPLNIARYCGANTLKMARKNSGTATNAEAMAPKSRLDLFRSRT
jgi:hypothetical protein